MRSHARRITAGHLCRLLMAVAVALSAIIVHGATPVAAAGIAVDALVSTDVSAISSTFTSPLFSTTQANELVLVFVGADNGPSETVTSVSGGGLTFSLVRRTNTQTGTAEIWKATTTGVLTNVQIAAGQSTGTEGAIIVATFTGVNVSNPTGATGTNNGATGAEAVSLTATQAGSVVWGIGSATTQGLARTVPGTQTMQHQFVNPGYSQTMWVQSVNATSTNGGTMTINETAPSTDMFNMSSVEILPLSPASSTQTITTTVAAGTLSLAAPAPAALGTLARGVNGPFALGTLSYTNTLNDGGAWSVTLGATDFGNSPVTFTNMSITPGAVTGAAGSVGVPTPGGAGQTLSGGDASPGTTVSTGTASLITSTPATIEGTYTQPSSITIMVPGTTPGGALPNATITYTITG